MQEVQDKMKKKFLLLLVSCFALSGCNFFEKIFGKKEEVPHEEVPFDGGGDTPGGGGGGYVSTCTYRFFLSYSHTSKYDVVLGAEVASPLFILKDVIMLEPLGAVPEALSTKEKVLALAEQKGFAYDPAFDKFLGFSHSTVCLDEEGLWDFSKDYLKIATVDLYGVWVSE